MRIIVFFVCLIMIFAVHAADLNLLRNPKDITDTAEQDDTVKAGANWDPAVNAYPHAYASGRQSMEFAESNLTRRLKKPWISNEGKQVWVAFDFEKIQAVRRMVLIFPEESTAPVSIELVGNNDGKEFVIRTLKPELLKKNLAVNFKNPVAVKTFKIIFRQENPGRIALAAASLQGTDAVPVTTAELKFKYDNPHNLAFNPKDAPDTEWNEKINGYPHVSAKNFDNRASQQGYPSFVNDGFYNRRFWTHRYNEWWPNWLKIDFAKETEFQYVKFFSTAGWNRDALKFLPKKMSISVSNDDFKEDIRQVMSLEAKELDASWNYQRLDEAKFIKLPQLTSARYIRFDFPEDQGRNRLLVEELEIYRDTPPMKKIERIDLDEPTLGGKVDAQILAKGSDAVFWLENNTRKVFREDVPQAENTDNTIRISAAANEKENFQLVIRPQRDLEKISLRFSPLTGPASNVINPDTMNYNFVGYVFVHTPSHVKWRGSDFSDGKRGYWPDPLLVETEMNIPKPHNVPVLCFVKVPKNTAAGKYRGTMDILENGKLLHRADLELLVRNFSLPDSSERKFDHRTMLPIRDSVSYIREITNGRFSEKEIVEAGARAIAENGFNAIYGSAYPEWAMPEVKITGDKLEINYDRFDQWTEYLLKLGFKTIEFPFRHQQHGNRLYLRKAFDWNGFPYMSVEYQKYFLSKDGYLVRTVNHLKEKGWISHFVLEIAHEPQAGDGIGFYDEAGELYKRVRALVPELKLLIGGNYIAGLKKFPEVLYHLDQVSVYLSGFTWNEIAGIKEKNPNIDLYCGYNGSSLIDFPGTNSRILAWLSWRNGGNGYGHYATVTAVDPWENTMTFNTFTAYNNTRCGDNMFLYPMRDPNADKPYYHSSVRLALEQKGCDDFEYLSILKDRIKALEASEGFSERVKQAKDTLTKAENIVKRPWRTATDSEFKYEFTDDPKDIGNARESVAQAIESLSR